MLTVTHIQWASIILRPACFGRSRSSSGDPVAARCRRNASGAGELSLLRPPRLRGALAELEMARRSLPNDPRIFELTGYILRRRGQQEEGLRNLEKQSSWIRAIATSATDRHQLPVSAALSRGGRHSDRALTIVPNDVATKFTRALVDFYWKADTQPLHDMIDSILAKNPGAISDAADNWFVCALAERDPMQQSRPWWRWATIHVGATTLFILSRTLGKVCWRG